MQTPAKLPTLRPPVELRDVFGTGRANERALKTLWAHLDEKQRKDLIKYWYFVVDSSSGRKYHIHADRGRNVEYRENKFGRVSTRYDARPPALPLGDVLLAQMLVLKAREQFFLRTACAARYTEFKPTKIKRQKDVEHLRPFRPAYHAWRSIFGAFATSVLFMASALIVHHLFTLMK